MALNHKITKTIPDQAYAYIGDALGIRHNGVLVFDTDDMISVLMDACIYDWYENDKNLIQRYAETHPPPLGTDENYLLQAYLQAKYRILFPQSAVPGAGLYCRDILNSEELFLMDVAMSQTISPKMGMATRTISLGEYWITGGAALPLTATKFTKDALSRIRPKQVSDPGELELSIARVCLDAGAADQVVYRSGETSSKEPTHLPRWPGSKRRRR